MLVNNSFPFHNNILKSRSKSKYSLTSLEGYLVGSNVGYRVGNNVGTIGDAVGYKVG